MTRDDVMPLKRGASPFHALYFFPPFNFSTLRSRAFSVHCPVKQKESGDATVCGQASLPGTTLTQQTLTRRSLWGNTA